MTDEVAREFKTVKDRMNEDERKLDSYFNALHETNASDISDNREGIMETFEATESNSTDLTDLREAVMELYEMMTE